MNPWLMPSIKKRLAGWLSEIRDKCLSQTYPRTDAIYSIACNVCDNEYIGQTKRQFDTPLMMAAYFLTPIYTSSGKRAVN